MNFILAILRKKRKIVKSYHTIPNDIILDLSGCSALNAMHCQSNSSMIVREIEDIIDTQVCQFMCNTVYGSVCKYFIHDLTMSTCIIINTEDIDNCDKVASGVITNIEECDPIFHSEDEDKSCLV